MPGVAPRPNNKAKRIAEAILGVPQNQPPKRRPRKQQEVDQANLEEVNLRSKT